MRMPVSITRAVGSGNGAHLSVEDGLDLDLPREVELFGGRFGAFIPFLEDFAEAGRVDFDELLERWPPCVHKLGGEEDIIYLQLSEVPFEEAEPFFNRAPLDIIGDVGGRIWYETHGGGAAL